MKWIELQYDEDGLSRMAEYTDDDVDVTLTEHSDSHTMLGD